MRVAVLTLGCKVNQYESRALEEALGTRGHEVVALGEAPDAVVINSCTVTHRSDRDARAVIRRVRREHPGARVAVTGCYAQVDPQALRDLGVELVVGTGEREALPLLLEDGAVAVRVGDVAAPRPLGPEPVGRFAGRARAFLKVQDGCQAFCAYCIVPYARGPSRSLPLAAVEAGLARLAAAGHQEVVLTGVHLGLWGQELVPRVGFGALLDAAEAAGIPRVRLSSLEPGELTGSVVARLATSAVLCPHLHVPLQSGSDRILAAMGRPYAAADFRGRVEAALGSVPGLALGLDVIVGFPGEDRGAFAETRGLLEALPLAYLHVFPFSPRRGTRAWDLPGRVGDAEVKARARELRDLGRQKARAFGEAHRGRVLPALAEGGVAGGVLTLRTRNYLAVRVPWRGPVPQQELPVRVERVDAKGAAGSAAGSPAIGG